jgi:hypothetical protein
MQMQVLPTAKLGGYIVIDELKLEVAILSNLNIPPYFKFSIIPLPSFVVD